MTGHIATEYGQQHKGVTGIDTEADVKSGNLASRTIAEARDFGTSNPTLLPVNLGVL